MKVWRFITNLFLIGSLSMQISFMSFASSVEDNSIFGTYKVLFQPGRSSGTLNSCTLAYRVIHTDYSYHNGDAILIDGNFGIFEANGNLILTLKIGIKELDSPRDAQYTNPYFAYLFTQNATTATSLHSSTENDRGFRLITFKFDDSSVKVLSEILETGRVNIGFNLVENGLDVLFPVNLQVSDTEVLASGKIVRRRSINAITQFLGCYKEILQQDHKENSK